MGVCKREDNQNCSGAVLCMTFLHRDIRTVADKCQQVLDFFDRFRFFNCVFCLGFMTFYGIDVLT